MLRHCLILMISCVVTTALVAQERSDPGREEIERILHDLEQGIEALKAIGDHEELVEYLEEVKASVKRRHSSRGGRPGPEHEESEREIVRRRLRVMRIAMKALLEEGRKDSAELVEHAIHARELALEGRRDAKARRIRDTAPDRDQLIELMAYAGQLWNKFGNEEAAGACAGLAKELRRGRRREAGDHRESGNAELEAARRQLRVKRWTLAALREAKREDAADLMHRAVRALEVAIEGRRDAEARKIRERQPERGAQVELLLLAAELYGEWGHEDRAHACAELAEAIAQRIQKRTPPRWKENVPIPIDGVDERIQALEKRVARLERKLKRLESAAGGKGGGRIR